MSAGNGPVKLIPCLRSLSSAGSIISISSLPSKQTANQYVHERGNYESSVEKFGIGYAPDSNATINYIKSNGFTMPESVEMGVVGFDSGRNFARFVERELVSNWHHN